MRRVAIFLACLFFTSMTVGFSGGQTQPTTEPAIELPPVIKDALERAATDLSPTVTVVWSEDYQPPLNPREYMDATGFKQVDHHRTFAQSEQLNLTWQSDGRYLLRFRQSFHPSGTDRTVARFNIVHSFDGTMFYEHIANPDEVHGLKRLDFNARAASDDRINRDYFTFIGFPLPMEADQLKKHAPLRSVIFELLDAADTYLASAEPAAIDGRPTVCLKIKRGPHATTISDDDERDSYEGEEDFYLDPALGYAQVRRQVFDAAGKLLCQTDCSDFVEQKMFFPRSVSLRYPVQGKAKAPRDHFDEATLTVSRIGFDALPAERFVLTDSTPGTRFIDDIGSNEVVHVLQRDGSLKLTKGKG